MLGFSLLSYSVEGTVRGEAISPQPESPPKQGLPSRAVPVMIEQTPPVEENARSYNQLFRLTVPYYDNVFAAHEPATPFRLDPSDYREVTAYTEPQGLLPLHPKNALWSLQPFVGIDQSYNSNIQQATTNPVGDSFTTLRFGADLQVGSPDSVYNSTYDTIFAFKMHHEFWADIFATKDQFNAINNRIILEGRVGRGDYIWRPFVTAEDITGSNLLTVERVGWVERDKLLTGVQGNYRVTPLITLNQTFSHLYFYHPDNQYINFQVARFYQEAAYRTFHDFDFFAWGEYRYTGVNKGADGTEMLGGFGWRGKPDPRLFSELGIGYESIELNQYQPGRSNLSGLYVTGHTSFEWSPRLRLVLRYDRNYTFNELTVNDNYVNNTLQFSAEIFMGGNWYLTPYFGVSYNEFETSHQETLEFRPELELAYALPNDSRCFVKIGYDTTGTVRGTGGTVTIYRCTTGFNWKF